MSRRDKKLLTDSVKGSKVEKPKHKKPNTYHLTFDYITESPKGSKPQDVTASSILNNPNTGVFYGHRTNEATNKHKDIKGGNGLLVLKTVKVISKLEKKGKVQVSSADHRAYVAPPEWKNDTHIYGGRFQVGIGSSKTEVKKIEKQISQNQSTIKSRI